MCVICVKKQGAENPDFSKIRNAARNNPDGFAIITRRGWQIETFRTMDADAFLREYSRRCDAPEWIIHCRIATHGSKRVSNCHGWRGAGLAFAHNGILSLKNRGDLTDSETFFRDILIPAFRCGGWVGAEKAINAVIGNSKFAVMSKSGVRIFGHWLDDDKQDGVFWSNGSFRANCYSPRSADYNLGFWPKDSARAIKSAFPRPRNYSDEARKIRVLPNGCVLDVEKFATAEK